MVQRIGGFRRKTRHKLSKRVRTKGKLSINRYLEEYIIGERVVLVGEPLYQKGMYFPRFHGRVGIITKKQGRCYFVKIDDLGKQKSILVHPVHLKRI